MDSLLSKTVSHLDRGNKLFKFTYIKKNEKRELWKAILDLYGAAFIEQRLLASLLNGIFSSDKPVFLLSVGMLKEIISHDKNLNKDSLSGTEYKKLMSLIYGTNILEVVKEPSQFKSGKRKAGLLRLVDKELRSFIPDINEKEKQAIELFCKIEKIETIVLTKIET